MLIVVPSAPREITNTVQLLTAAGTQEALNQAVVVENRPGAGGRSPEQSRALVKSEIQKWDDVMRQTGIKIDQ